MQIDWLLDIKELEISADSYKSVAEVDDTLVSIFRLKLFFREKSICFQEDLKEFKKVESPVQVEDT